MLNCHEGCNRCWQANPSKMYNLALSLIHSIMSRYWITKDDLRNLAKVCTVLHIQLLSPQCGFIVCPVVTVRVEMHIPCIARLIQRFIHAEVYSLTECQDKLYQGWRKVWGLRMQKPPHNFTWQWLLYPIACVTLENDLAIVFTCTLKSSLDNPVLSNYFKVSPRFAVQFSLTFN